MRNITFAAALAEQERRPDFAVVVAYVAGARSARHTEHQVEEFASLLLSVMRSRFGFVSYEAIADVAEAHDDMQLACWVRTRLRDGLASTSPARFES